MDIIKECFFQNKKLTDINPKGVGYQQCGAKHSCGPQKRDCWIIHFVISGKGMLRLNHKTYHIHENQMFIIPPDEIFYYQADAENPWEYTWITFDGDYANRLHELGRYVVDIEQCYFENVLGCKKFPGAEAEYLASCVWRIFAKLFSKKGSTNYVIMVKEYINDNYMNDIVIGDIAKNIGLDRKYLSRIFKEVMGITIRDYLNEVRITKAKNFLVDYHYNVITTASLTGYSDSVAFSKFFKRHTGHSPKYYLELDSDEDFNDIE